MINEKIKTLRANRNMTQKELARSAGVSQSFISEIEAGRKSPTDRSLKKIAKGLNCSITIFYTDEEMVAI